MQTPKIGSARPSRVIRPISPNPSTPPSSPRRWRRWSWHRDEPPSLLARGERGKIRLRIGGCMKLLTGSLIALALILQSGSLSAQQGLGGAGQALPSSLLQCADVAAALTAVTNQDTRLRDWANLARYRDANKTATRADVVFMGDSITDFWQQPRFGGFFPGKNYADRGISAQTTPQMLIRFRPDVIALKPRAVVILAGTNDIAGNTGPMTNEEIQNNLASMAELAKANNIK